MPDRSDRFLFQTVFLQRAVDPEDGEPFYQTVVTRRQPLSSVAGFR